MAIQPASVSDTGHIGGGRPSVLSNPYRVARAACRTRYCRADTLVGLGARRRAANMAFVVRPRARRDDIATINSRASELSSMSVSEPEHDPEKCGAVFGKRSCSTKDLKRDDDSKKSHLASGADQSRTWTDPAFEPTEFLSAYYRDFVFPPHVHETFAIGIIEIGGLRSRPGRGPPVIMPAGKLCAINPGVKHEGMAATSDGWRYRMFYPSPALVARTLGSHGGDWGLDRHVIDDPELFRAFEGLHASSELRETLFERETRIAVFVRRLFERHGNVSPGSGQARVAPRTVAIVRDYLHAKAESQVSIADLAQAAGVSDTQVIRAFSAETGMPPHSYLVSLRVERAKALLRAGTSPAAAALHVGFSDQSQLTRHFKRLTGVTPGRFAAEASLAERGHGFDKMAARIPDAMPH